MRLTLGEGKWRSNSYTHINWFIIQIRESVFHAHPLHIDEPCVKANDSTAFIIFNNSLKLSYIIFMSWLKSSCTTEPTSTFSILQISCQVSNVTCTNEWHFMFMQFSERIKLNARDNSGWREGHGPILRHRFHRTNPPKPNHFRLYLFF